MFYYLCNSILLPCFFVSDSQLVLNTVTWIMKIFRRLIVFAILIWIIRIPIEVKYIFEFKSVALSDYYEKFVNYGMGIFIFAFFLTFIKRENSIGKNLLLVLGSVICSLVMFFLFFLAVFADEMCSYKTTKIIETISPTKQVVEREFGCGATDSSSPTVKKFFRNEYFNLIYTYKLID
jgi:hypothetical protein